MATLITSIRLQDSKIPKWMIWVQCIAFAVLYAVWILPEIAGFRNTALVVGAVFGTYSIYQYRAAFLEKSALPIWLIVALFAWATFHLVFIGSNFPIQYIEYFRIWKYAAIGALMAVGLGLTLANLPPKSATRFWYVMYFGLCTPLIIYIIKYLLTHFDIPLGLRIPLSLRVYDSSVSFYVPKMDYVAFCLPVFSVALGLLLNLAHVSKRWTAKEYLNLAIQISVIAATLFLFIAQNIKNGIAYSGMLFRTFSILFFFGKNSKLNWKKLLAVLATFSVPLAAIAFNVQKNDSWRTVIADTKVAVQIEKYPHWKGAAEYGYPLNEYGTTVSITNYERAAWATVGMKLSFEDPLSYGLVEDSFAKMARARWPDVGSNLSHSHSGWLDVILAIGYPGFLLIIGVLLFVLKGAHSIKQPWAVLAFWPLFANLLLWCTTEASATVTFAAIIFWILLSASLGLQKINVPEKSLQ